MPKTIKDVSDEVATLREEMRTIKEMEQLKASMQVVEKKITKWESVFNKILMWIVIGALAVWAASALGFLTMIINALFGNPPTP